MHHLVIVLLMLAQTYVTRDLVIWDFLISVGMILLMRSLWLNDLKRAANTMIDIVHENYVRKK